MQGKSPGVCDQCFVGPWRHYSSRTAWESTILACMDTAVWLGAVCLATKMQLKYTDTYTSECFGSYKRWNYRLILSLKGCPSNCLCLPFPNLAYLTRGKEDTGEHTLLYSAQQTSLSFVASYLHVFGQCWRVGGVEKQRLSQLFGSLLIHYLKNNALRTKSKKIKCWVNSNILKSRFLHHSPKLYLVHP